MKASREAGRIRLNLDAGEAAVLRSILASLASAYRVPPEEVDPKLAAVWYSQRGCQSAGMSREDAREWVRQIHGFKGANLALIQEWLKQIGVPGKEPAALVLPDEQAESFVGVLNDHRLRMAALHGIGQEEMDLRTEEDWERIGPDRQSALIQIHVLAWIIETVLRLTAPDAAGWME